MTTTSRTATTAQSNHVNPALRAPIVVAPRGRRRPGLITAGVALAMLGALLGVRLVATAGDRTGVVVLARDVPYGSVLTAEDLRVTQVSVDPTVATVPAERAPSVVGMTAAADLVAGSLLARAQVAAAGPPGRGQVVVPLPLDAKKLPAGRELLGIQWPRDHDLAAARRTGSGDLGRCQQRPGHEVSRCRHPHNGGRAFGRHGGNRWVDRHLSDPQVLGGKDRPVGHVAGQD